MKVITTTECADDQCEFSASEVANIVLLTATSCPHCQTMKNIVSKQIDEGKIQVIDENDPRFLPMVESERVDAVPTFFVDGKACDFTGTAIDPKLDCDGNEVQL